MEKIKVLLIDENFINLARKKVNNDNIIINIHSLDKSKTGIIYYSDEYGYEFDGLFLGIQFVDEVIDPYDKLELIISDDNIQFTAEFGLYKDFVDYERITIDSDLITIQEYE